MKKTSNVGEWDEVFRYGMIVLFLAFPSWILVNKDHYWIILTRDFGITLIGVLYMLGFIGVLTPYFDNFRFGSQDLGIILSKQDGSINYSGMFTFPSPKADNVEKTGVELKYTGKNVWEQIQKELENSEDLFSIFIEKQIQKIIEKYSKVANIDFTNALDSMQIGGPLKTIDGLPINIYESYLVQSHNKILVHAMPYENLTGSKLKEKLEYTLKMSKIHQEIKYVVLFIRYDSLEKIPESEDIIAKMKNKYFEEISKGILSFNELLLDSKDLNLLLEESKEELKDSNA
ncbi:hypothetical protein HNP92_001229 [Methanococcus maripaludis]|uniref:Uncharacterized protein n=1 Tax=Methanococcus maripaludis TaxID=39152 RepID=A0A7J9S7U1_METMI|nr:hypothetical protein [Methanococcus maripaludis]MBB6401924.1 hypothetical protein [Methanococcus maripaludis]